jgi:hypothetical protein
VTCKFVRRPYLAEYHIAAWNVCGDPENKNLAVEFDSNVKPDGNRAITGSPWRNEHGIFLPGRDKNLHERLLSRIPKP